MDKKELINVLLERSNNYIDLVKRYNELLQCKINEWLPSVVDEYLKNIKSDYCIDANGDFAITDKYKYLISARGTYITYLPKREYRWNAISFECQIEDIGYFGTAFHRGKNDFEMLENIIKSPEWLETDEINKLISKIDDFTARINNNLIEIKNNKNLVNHLKFESDDLHIVCLGIKELDQFMQKYMIENE